MSFSNSTWLQILGYSEGQTEAGLEARVFAQGQDIKGPQGEHFNDEDVWRPVGDRLMGPHTKDLE